MHRNSKRTMSIHFHRPHLSSSRTLLYAPRFATPALGGILTRNYSWSGAGARVPEHLRSFLSYDARHWSAPTPFPEVWKAESTFGAGVSGVARYLRHTPLLRQLERGEHSLP